MKVYVGMEQVDSEFVHIDFYVRSRDKFIQKKTRKKVLNADILRGEGDIKK
jgi:hypothetical protein